MLFAFFDFGIYNCLAGSLVRWLVGGHAQHAMLNNFVANAYWTVILLFALGTKYNLLSDFHAPNFFLRLLLSDCPTQAAAVAVTRFQMNLRNRQSCWSFFPPTFVFVAFGAVLNMHLFIAPRGRQCLLKLLCFSPGPGACIMEGMESTLTTVTSLTLTECRPFYSILIKQRQRPGRACGETEFISQRSCRTEKLCLLLPCIHGQFRDSKYDCSLNWH